MIRVARALLYGGIAAIVLGLSKAHAAYVAEPAYDFTGSTRFAWAFALMAILAVSAYGIGLPDTPRTLLQAEATAVAASVLGAVGMSLVQLLVGDALLPRYVVLGSALLTIPWYLACTAVAHGGRLQAVERDRVAVVAEPAEIATLDDELQRFPERPAQVVLHLTPEAARAADGAQPLVEQVRSSGATVVVLARSAQADDTIVVQAAMLHEAGVRVRTLSLFYEQWLGKLPLSELERVSLMFDIGEVHRVRYGRAKRLVDVLVGLVGLAVLVVVTPFVVLGDLVANRGSLFFSQPRVGKNGRTFRILKFRTMRAVPDTEAGSWTTDRDPRVTRFGRVLRTTHLDELPQMVNILRGDLSLVGPRPEQPRYVDELSEKLPFYDLRHLVRPGLTGWAQVKYGYAADDADAMEKLQYEFYYLRHQRLSLDLRIIGRTIRSVVGREGR